MEFNQNLKLVEVSSYLSKELGEKSIRWADLQIDKMLIQESIPLQNFTEEMEKTYSEVKTIFGNKDEKTCQKIFNKLTEEQQKQFNKVSMFKLKQRALKDIDDKIKEIEEKIRVTAVLKKEIDNKE